MPRIIVHSLRPVTALLIASSFIGVAQRSNAQPNDPGPVVRTFMGEFYGADSSANFRSPASARRYFTPATARTMVAQGRKNIDADFIVEGQDYELKDVRYTASDTSASKATVTVQFVNFGNKVTNHFRMAYSDGRWLIQDICKPNRSCITRE